MLILLHLSIISALLRHKYSMSPHKVIDVVAGILVDAQGRLLLTERRPSQDFSGCWEFPGGKCNAGENAGTALLRELQEELGIRAGVVQPLIRIPWVYPHQSIILEGLRVRSWQGTPHGREGQRMAWLTPDAIDATTMPPADRPLLAAACLPRTCEITADLRDAEALRVDLQQRLQGGDALLQIRSPGLAMERVRDKLGSVFADDAAARQRCLLNADIEGARRLGCGVQLKSRQLTELGQRPLPAGQWVGASCHDAAELQRAAALNCDFALLSPVAPSASHPHTPALGWAGFARLVVQAQLPVYALGGMAPEDWEQARACGGQGVAGIRAFSVDC